MFLHAEIEDLAILQLTVFCIFRHVLAEVVAWGIYAAVADVICWIDAIFLGVN